MHSISVFETMAERFFEEGDSMESFAICGLLHDVCKAQFYKVSSRNVKNPDTGRWEPQPYYAIEDQFPYGHGEKNRFSSSSAFCAKAFGGGGYPLGMRAV